MATENVTPTPAEQAGQILQPQEYLHWLLGLEHKFGGLPSGTRAYLVSIDPGANTRRLTPVGEDDAVVNLEDLPRLIREGEMLGTEWLQEIRQACAQRLAGRGIKVEPGEKDRTRARQMLADADEVAGHSGRQIRAIASAIQALLPKDPFRHPLLKISPETAAADGLKFELRDGITAVREFAGTLDHIGCTLEDSLPDRINEAMVSLGLGNSPSYRAETAAEEAGHE